MQTLLLLLALAGQAPAAPPQLYELTDSSGQRWSSPDPAWLQSWVAQRNASARAGQSPAVVNYGVDVDQFPNHPGGQAWYGGNLDSQPSVTGSGIEPTAPVLHVTLIGSTATSTLEGWRRSNSWRALESELGQRLAVQPYDDPANPIVADVGLPDGGRPDIVIQQHDGKVLARWHDDPGADQVVSKLRELDRSYNPRLDPGGERLTNLFLGGGWVLVALGLVVLLLRRSPTA